MLRHPAAVVAIAAWIVVGGGETAGAQAPASVDLFGGYSFHRESAAAGAPATRYDRGWVASGAVPVFARSLAIVGEVGSNWRTNTVGETQRLVGVLGGGRVSLVRTARLAAFVQALMGLERFSEPGFDESGLAFQPGAGFDVATWGAVGVRAQADWRLSRQNEVTYKAVRLAVGVVVTPGT